MSDKRYEANIIRATAVEPANNLESTSAPGVWSIDEVVELQKKNKWPTAGNVASDVTDVFSTFLYDGNNSSNTISNNIDLSGKGGLVWIKSRSGSAYHTLFDTARGVNKALFSNATDAETSASYNQTFTSSGFTLNNTFSAVNDVNANYVSWTFRKAPKFFDVVTYSGTGSAQNISHNLGSVPGMIIIKGTNITENWIVYHRSLGETKYIQLNSTGAAGTSSIAWNDTAPTSTQFTVNTFNAVNESGYNYVAYLFAHNNNDGEFGPDGDQDIIKCGSFTSDSSGIATVDLGFEPQWVLFKGTHAGSSWFIVDVMRGMVNGGNDAWLAANLSNAEGTSNTVITPTPTGFVTDGTNIVDPSQTFIYMAIRRGPLAAPTDATKVFSVDYIGSSAPYFDSNHIVDMGLVKLTTASSSWFVYSRLLGEKALYTDSTAAESNASEAGFDFMNGHIDALWGDSNAMSWMWKRAPSYFDVVAYSGNDTAGRTVSHNLGVAPEMMWVKRRNSTGGDWEVYHKDTGNTKYLTLNSTAAASTNQYRWNNTTPTESVFTIGTATNVNANGDNFIAYLFATVAGVSKVGSYTGNAGASTINVDCGFSSGARFVLIKESSGTGDWWVFDTVRGLVAGNDAALKLNTTDAESSFDYIDPYSGGFSLQTNSGINTNGATFIFYAIA